MKNLSNIEILTSISIILQAFIFIVKTFSTWNDKAYEIIVSFIKDRLGEDLLSYGNTRKNYLTKNITKETKKELYKNDAYKFASLPVKFAIRLKLLFLKVE